MRQEIIRLAPALTLQWSTHNGLKDHTEVRGFRARSGVSPATHGVWSASASDRRPAPYREWSVPDRVDVWLFPPFTVTTDRILCTDPVGFRSGRELAPPTHGPGVYNLRPSPEITMVVTCRIPPQRTSWWTVHRRDDTCVGPSSPSSRKQRKDSEVFALKSFWCFEIDFVTTDGAFNGNQEESGVFHTCYSVQTV